MNRNTSNQKRGDEVPGFKVLADQCIWMKAGVVNFHMCDHDYDCFRCPFDRAMRAAMDAQMPPRGEERPTGWAAEMRKKYLGVRKPCRHFVTGRIDSPENCARDYDCDSCPVELELGYGDFLASMASTRPTDEAAQAELSEKRRFPFPNNECIWMKAGIIGLRLCDSDYDCYHCEFDRIMRTAMEEGPPRAKEAWLEVLAGAVEPVARPCIYGLIGRADAPPVCHSNYACHDCPTHQALAGEKEIRPQPVHHADERRAAGYPLAGGYYYHFGHSWVHVIHGDCVRVGVDSFIGKVLGPVEGLDLPAPGTDLGRTKVGWVLKRGEHRAPVLCPLTGRILAVNPKVVKDPGILSSDPYHEGWLFQMEPVSLKREAQALYNDDDALQWLERENRELMRMMGPDYERLTATGGEVVSDLFGRFPQLGWEPLTRAFLRTADVSEKL